MSGKKRKSRRKALPRPFLKWAGGKGQLLGPLLQQVGRAGPFGAYHEPFVGGGALFFELFRQDRLRGGVFLSDSNPNLVEVYQGVRDHVDEVIDLLHHHKARHDKDHYYRIRAQVPDSLAARTARVIYLNKTCFNGLYRENRKGHFNVPMGRYTNPNICDENNLRAVAKALDGCRLEARPFDSVLEVARPGDLVYFDPPYHPVSKTSSFTAYAKGGFGEEAQRRLAQVFAKLAARGVKVLLSNSMTDLVRELYRPFPIDKVKAARSVNSKADRRGKIAEALVRSF